MSQRTFLVFLLLMSGVGFILRLHNYDRLPPFGTTQDEFLYAWQGMTLLQGQPPLGWSQLSAYPKKEVVTKWGIDYPLVRPWLEKPPLYFLVVGVILISQKVTDPFLVRLNLIRLVPIVLSGITIPLIGIFARRLFSPSVGIMAAVLYSTVPTITIANRTSLAESLLTPLVLTALCYF